MILRLAFQHFGRGLGGRLHLKCLKCILTHLKIKVNVSGVLMGVEKDRNTASLRLGVLRMYVASWLNRVQGDTRYLYKILSHRRRWEQSEGVSDS